MKTFLICFLLGGGAYVLLELMWRGRSHISMFAAGGICFALLDAIFFRYQLPLLPSALIGAALITAVEFLTGYLVNIRLGLGVWDYSHVPGNLYGQVCVWFSALWAALSIGIVYLSAALHGMALL